MKQFFSRKGASFSFFVLLLSAVIFLGLTACGGKSSSTSDTPAAKYKFPDRSDQLVIGKGDVLKEKTLKDAIDGVLKDISGYQKNWKAEGVTDISFKEAVYSLKTWIHITKLTSPAEVPGAVIIVVYEKNPNSYEEIPLTLGLGEFSKTFGDRTINLTNLKLVVTDTDGKTVYTEDFTDYFYGK
ncbi:MAG: hypothetical protein LBO74_04255 [Candidatus Symbiothrix sp.]|jgi:hypothetical protein|nr:hypothetical protein [Candidatus Symbiothrix sp.]